MRSPIARRGLVRPHHQRNVGPVDIGIQQPGLVAQLRQRNRQIHGNGGLPDAAFAAAHGNQIRNSRYRQLRLHLLSRTHVLPS